MQPSLPQMPEKIAAKNTETIANAPTAIEGEVAALPKDRRGIGFTRYEAALVALVGQADGAEQPAGQNAPAFFLNTLSRLRLRKHCLCIRWFLKRDCERRSK